MDPRPFEEAIAQLCGCHDLLRASGAGKGRLGKLVDAVKQAAAEPSVTSKPSGLISSLLDAGVKALVHVLSGEEVHAAVHSLSMLLALGAIVALALLHLKPRRGLLLAPLLLAALANAELLRKAGGALAAEEVPLLLRLPLRVAALAWQMPPGFAACQAASLAAAVSAEAASGRLHRAFAGDWYAAVAQNSEALRVAPLLLGLLRATWSLRDRAGYLSLAALLSTLFSPLALLSWWPLAAGLLGLPAGAAGLLQATSLAFALVFFGFTLSGGTVSLISSMALLHLLSGIHGIEALGMEGLGLP